ncbi:MAG: hypothetical protein IT554_08550 [Sphingomonadaceae bacterium]|nr:hypothetical protein [Sphingomonadaceae bacterium]
MPALLLRFLPHIGIVCAVLFGVWWIYDSGQDAERTEANERNATLRADMQADARAFEQRLGAQLSIIAADVATQGEQIQRLRASSNTIIQREIIHDPRLVDPDLGISERMFDAINTTRTGGGCASATGGGIVCTVRRPAPTGEPIEGGDSDEGQ